MESRPELRLAGHGGLLEPYFISLAILNQKKTSSAALWNGAFLLAFGLADSLLANLFRHNTLAITDQLATYLSNFSLVTAGLGANLIASSTLISDPPSATSNVSSGGQSKSNAAQPPMLSGLPTTTQHLSPAPVVSQQLAPSNHAIQNSKPSGGASSPAPFSGP